jgi:hypothetical protein
VPDANRERTFINAAEAEGMKPVLPGFETRCCTFSGGIYSQEKRESATEYRLSVDPLSGNLNQVASTSADLHIQCIKIEGPR